MVIPGGLRRPPDVLPQEQVHRGGHHQQWQGVSNNLAVTSMMAIKWLIMAGYNTLYVQVWELPRPLHGRGQVTVQLTV